MSTPPPDADADFKQVEDDLAELLRTQYGARITDLELTRGQQWAYDARSRESIARILAEPRESDHRSAVKRRVWVLAAAATAAAVAGPLLWPFADHAQQAYAATPPILDIAGTNASHYPLVGIDPDHELRHLASLARTSPSVLTGVSSGVDMGRGQVGDAQHVEVDSWWLETSDHGRPSAQVVPTQTQRYVLPNGSIRVATSRGRPLAGGTETRPSHGPVSVVSAPASSATGLVNHPSRLSLNPAKLRAQLIGNPRQCAGQEGYCLSDAIETLGQSDVLSPRLDSALLLTLVGAPDVRYAGTALDRAGRSSAVFVIVDPDHARQRLVLFDADTGAYNGDETVLVNDSEHLGVKAPAVIGFDVVVTRQWIPAGAVPPAR